MRLRYEAQWRIAGLKVKIEAGDRFWARPRQVRHLVAQQYGGQVSLPSAAPIQPAWRIHRGIAWCIHRLPKLLLELAAKREGGKE
jgi:hypothetical protein